MDEYIAGVIRVAIAQVVLEAGFEEIKMSSMELFTDVLMHYIKHLGLCIKANTFSAGRVESNFVDVIKGMEEMGINLEELRGYHSKSDNLPFAKELPIQKPKQVTLVQGPPEDCETDERIPSFLPRWPAKRTYIETSVPNTREDDPKVVREKQIIEARHIEGSLTQLHSQQHKLIPLRKDI